MKVEIRIADLVAQVDADALVNSANANLRLGSGVAGAIHTAAGPELEAYCQQFVPLTLGGGVVTPGFNLANPWVIHVRAASFINDEEPELHLKCALETVFDLAAAHAIHSIAMPAIGTGVFKCPPAVAAKVTATAFQKAMRTTNELQWLRICVTSRDLALTYRAAFAEVYRV